MVGIGSLFSMEGIEAQKPASLMGKTVMNLAQIRDDGVNVPRRVIVRLQRTERL